MNVYTCTIYGGSNPGRVKSKTEKLAPASSLVSVHHLRSR